MASPRTFYPITGIKTDGDRPIRKDVNDWYIEQTCERGDHIQLTLFVEALTAIQKRPLNDERSYFRLAGIHAALGTVCHLYLPKMGPNLKTSVRITSTPFRPGIGCM